MSTIRKAAGYLSRIEPSIQGSSGRTQAFKAALALIKGFSLTDSEALPLFLEWNNLCVPPWPEDDLRRFLRDAAKSSKPDGYLLKGKMATGAGLDPETIARHKRETWPAFHRATEADIITIAALRALSPLSISCLRNHGFLSRCNWRGLTCFVIHHGTFAQVRRMDSQPFITHDGRSLKALNLPGSAGSFLNPGGLGSPGIPVVLAEGVVSLLESIEAINRADDAAGQLHGVAVIAATSAGSRFTAEWLAKLRDRPVLIICDNDKAGLDASAIWAASLRNVNCAVKCALPPSGCKDLGDTLKTIPAGDTYWSKLLTF